MQYLRIIGEKFTAPIFSATCNAAILVIAGFFLMIDVLAYPHHDSPTCRFLNPWSIVLVIEGILLGAYAFFASASRGVFKDGQDQGAGPNDEKYRPPFLYIAIIVIFSSINIAFASQSLEGLDFCSGRLGMIWPSYSLAALIIGPAAILASFLLLLQRKQLYCINLIQARYWLTNFLICSFTWMIWLALPCSGCKMKDDADYEREFQQSNPPKVEESPQHQSPMYYQGDYNNNVNNINGQYNSLMGDVEAQSGAYRSDTYR